MNSRYHFDNWKRWRNNKNREGNWEGDMECVLCDILDTFYLGKKEREKRMISDYDVLFGYLFISEVAGEERWNNIKELSANAYPERSEEELLERRQWAELNAFNMKRNHLLGTK